MLRLVERADALIEGFRPGVTERLGLGPDECLARRPTLVYGRMTGWGQDGPQRPGRRARHQLRRPVRHAGDDRPGRRAAGPAAQPRGRLRRRRAAAGLRDRVRHRRGGRSGAGPGRRRRDGRRRRPAGGDDARPAGRPWGTWGKRGRTCSTAAPGSTRSTRPPTAATSRSARSTPAPAELVRPPAGRRRRRRGPVPDPTDRASWPDDEAARMAAVMRTRARRVVRSLDGTDACFAPVLDPDEAPHHPHLRERGTFTEVGGVVQPAPAPRFSRTPRGRRTPARPWRAHRRGARRLGFRADGDRRCAAGSDPLGRPTWRAVVK